MDSPRLAYRPVAPGDLDELHSLIADPHVARYLLDGNRFPPSWTAERISDSQALFERQGVGLWLAHTVDGGALAGFCGFIVMPDIDPAPQLVYALFERFAGQGYATEMARAAMAHARATGGFDEILASVDEVNVASLHVLEKLGFRRIAVQTGAFGRMYLLRQIGTNGNPRRS